MAFEPTFEEIGREADALPDLDGEEDGGVDTLDGDEDADALPPQGA